MEEQQQGAKVGILAVINGAPRDWVDSVRSLEREALRNSMPLRVAVLDNVSAEPLLGGGTVCFAKQWSLSKATAEMLSDEPDIGSILLVTAPVSVPKDIVSRAGDWMQCDPRIATVSFLSNAAGPFSFPYLNTTSSHCMPQHDEESLTTLLRTVSPDPGAVPVSLPAGSAILISRSVMTAVGGFEPMLDVNPAEAVAELALRASRRGFQHRIDTATYVFCQWFDGFPGATPAEDNEARHRLHKIDSSFPSLYDQQKQSAVAPVAIAMDVARSKALGLRVLIDASCLGPTEMGTQVQTVELVRALLAKEDIASLALAVPNGTVPPYAEDLVTSTKVRILNAGDLWFNDAEAVDILHRPFQPDCRIPWERWRGLAKRTVVTLQDLIAYRIGAYHPTGDAWLRYRHNISDACAHADAVIVISEDTRHSVYEERLDISGDQIYTVMNGSNHLGSADVEAAPLALIERGMIASRFLLVLGATYAHKNRDLAIRAWKQIRDHGHNVALVMAGANVPKGSSRLEEAIACRATVGPEDPILCLPDVNSSVRTWLLRHASVVIYPTSAEGFGLIPFEAAAMGTPTAHVRFGPLRELIDDPAAPEHWDVGAIADYTETLLTDPAAAAENIARILRSGEQLTWAATATELVETYRRVLSLAPRN